MRRKVEDSWIVWIVPTLVSIAVASVAPDTIVVDGIMLALEVSY